MAWTAFRRSLVTGNALSEREARVRRGGQVVISRAAAESAGLTDRAFVLFDLETVRLAFRKPDESEVRDSIKIKGEGDPKSVGLRFLVMDCRAVFRAAEWMATAERKPGKKPRTRVRYEDRKELYTIAASSSGPAMLVVKLDGDRSIAIEDGAEE